MRAENKATYTIFEQDDPAPKLGRLCVWNRYVAILHISGGLHTNPRVTDEIVAQQSRLVSNMCASPLRISGTTERPWTLLGPIRDVERTEGVIRRVVEWRAVPEGTSLKLLATILVSSAAPSTYFVWFSIVGVRKYRTDAPSLRAKHALRQFDPTGDTIGFKQGAQN